MAGPGTGVAVLDWLIVAATALTAVTVLYRKGVRPFLAGVRKLLGMADTLADIAVEFRPNHGTSLKDQFAKLADDVAEIKATQAASAVLVAQTAKVAADALADHVEQDLANFAEVRETLEAGRHTFEELREGHETLAAGQQVAQASLRNLEQTLIPDEEHANDG